MSSPALPRAKTRALPAWKLKGCNLHDSKHETNSFFQNLLINNKST